MQTERSPLVQTFSSRDVDNALVEETNKDLREIVDDLTSLNEIINKANSMYLHRDLIYSTSIQGRRAREGFEQGGTRRIRGQSVCG